MSQVIDYHTMNVGTDLPAEANGTLDPKDWKSSRMQAHRMLDDMLDYTENIRERPVWKTMPDEARARFHPGPDKGWNYRRPAVERVCKAVGKMLLDRAEGSY